MRWIALAFNLRTIWLR